MTGESDRRWYRRRASVFSALVVFGDPVTTIPCAVQNMSATGAQLTFATAVDVPPQFRREIPQLDLKVEAQLAWSQEEEHGVKLLWPQQTPHS